MSELDSDSILEPAPNIRRATVEDLEQVIDLDTRSTGQPKEGYWADIFERYGVRRVNERFFLIAESSEEDKILGFVVGEVREWEFGSEQCGWIFAITVEPGLRRHRVGEALFEAICQKFREAGVYKIRTMARRDNILHMAFFRGEGMAAGPFIQLELTLDQE